MKRGIYCKEGDFGQSLDGVCVSAFRSKDAFYFSVTSFIQNKVFATQLVKNYIPLIPEELLKWS